MNNRTAYFVRSKQSFEIRDEKLGELPSQHHILVKNKWVGICGSDINSLEVDFLDEIVLGHEWVGEIIQLGTEARGFSVGDFVTSGNKIQCGYCLNCQNRVGICENLLWLTANHGMFKEYTYLPSASLMKLSGDVSKSSTLFEIIAVGENVWLKARQDFEKSSGKVLIMGAGLLGLSVALVLAREGIEFEMVEMIPSRISRAQSLGFNCSHLSMSLMDTSSKDHYQCIVDATGDHLGSAGGWKYLEHYGAAEFSAIILAKYIADIPLKTTRFFAKQASIRWIQGGTDDSLAKAIDSFKDEIDKLGSILITHTFPLQEIEQAFAVAKDRKISGRVIVEI